MSALRFDGADWAKFATLTTVADNLANGAWTMAVLFKRASIGSHFSTMSYLTAAGVTKAGMSIQTNNSLITDYGSGSVLATIFADTSLPYLFVPSKGAGSITPKISWKLGAAGSWTDEAFASAIADQVAADALEIGTWQGGSDLADGWFGVLGWWEGEMTPTQKKELDNNWRTSDWYSCSFGPPVILVEFNVDAANLVDIMGNATGLSVTGSPTLDTGENLDGWTFDGNGTAPPQKIRPDADIVTTGWSTAPLWSKIDEASAGADIISGVAS